MSENEAKFLPFNAINEFMLDDYRHTVLVKVFANTQGLPPERQKALNGLVKRLLSVPGFRNSTQAPAPVKAKAAVNPFIRSAEFSAQVLQGWSELYPELRQRVYDMLKARNWEVLPVETDHTRLPGFFIQWPKEENYDVLDKAYSDAYPDAKDEVNDIRLMIVWVSGRLPYNMYDEDGSEEGTGTEAGQ
jgi:hypothetical protein